MVDRSFASSLTAPRHSIVAPSGLEVRLRRRADELGMSVSQMLEHDALAASRTNYPTPECLDPLEIAQIFSDDLSPAKQEHLSKCPMCSALAEAANPPEAWFKEVLKTEAAAASEPKRAAASSTANRFFLAVSYGGAGVVASIVAFVLYQYAFNDAILSALVRNGALRIFAQLALCSAALCAVAFVSSRYIVSPTVRPGGAMAIVVVFAAGLTILIARDYATFSDQYEDMTATQASLVKQIAASARLPLPAQLTEEAPGALPGWVIVKKDHNSEFSVLWNKVAVAADSHAMPIAKIYEGRVQRVNNVLEVSTKSNGSMKISARAMDASIKVGDQVMALVPNNSSNVSQISAVPAAK